MMKSCRFTEVICFTLTIKKSQITTIVKKKIKKKIKRGENQLIGFRFKNIINCMCAKNNKINSNNLSERTKKK